MFKIIREDDVVYFCNAVGEVFCWDFHTKDGKPDLSLENPYSSTVNEYRKLCAGHMKPRGLQAMDFPATLLWSMVCRACCL